MYPIILVIEDHPLYRDALIVSMERMLKSMVFASANSVEEVQKKFKVDDRIDLLMLDLGLPGIQGEKAVNFLRKLYPATPLLVLSAQEERREVNACLAAGATAFVSKSVTVDVIADVLTKILSRQMLDSKWIVPRQRIVKDTTSSFELTSRQQEILLLLCQGYSNKEIARRLDIVELTVKSHVSTIFKAMNVINRIQAVQLVRQMGMHP
ncbi:LuxR C-terminal-related transcriptional regulator [Undibacterium sp. Di27W]|uniref:LuxR C-terminal-related transcriptional regulator n=1 Tax=Undibacterium sp. Di27W TaxID=3413036 RepID=UPI003BF14551